VAEPAAPIREEVIDLRAYLQVINKWRKVIIAGVLLTAFTAGIISFFILPPVYEAEVLLLAAQASEKQPVAARAGEGIEGVVELLTRIPVLTINTYLGQIKSEVLLRRVIEKLELDPLLYTPATLAGMIKASVQRNSNLIELKVQNTDPKLAALIANTLSNEFIKLLSEKNQEQMARSVEFLAKQREMAEKELDKAVQGLREFQGQPRGVAVLEEEFKLKAADLAQYKARRDTVLIEIRQLEAGLARLEQELATTPPVIGVSQVDPATGQIVETEEPNPVYQNLAEKVADKKAILAEKQAELAAIEDFTAGLTGELDKLHAELTEKSAQQDKLQGEVTRLKETLNTLASKITETQIARSLDLGQTTIVVVSEASTPERPVKPKKKLNIAAAFILGLIIFTGLAFVLEHLDYTVKTPENVAEHLDLPVLGVIPLATARTSKASYGGG